jgi:histidyl-tRNA synthetase
MRKQTVPSVKGMNDILPDRLRKMQFVENLLLQLSYNYGYLQVKTPSVEHAELYTRTSEFSEGKSYPVIDPKDRGLMLKNDPCAPLVRFAIENLVNRQSAPFKLVVCDSIFRSTNRKRREFRMFNLACFGIAEPTADAEILRILVDFLETRGLVGCKITFNNLQLYTSLLFKEVEDTEKVGAMLHQVRFANDLEAVREILIASQISEPISSVVLQVWSGVQDTSVLRKIASTLNFYPFTEIVECLVNFETILRSRGLDQISLNTSNLHGTGFYSGLTYKLIAPGEKGCEIADGGRYDNMFTQLGGPDMSACGIGLGIERLVEILDSYGCQTQEPNTRKSVFVINELDRESFAKWSKTIRQLRIEGFKIEEDLSQKKFQKSFTRAKLLGYDLVLVIRPAGDSITVQIIETSSLLVKELTMDNEVELYALLRR